MKKFILILLFAVPVSVVLKAQQLPQITQYMENNYAINPAFAGMYDYYQLNTTVRNMWDGVPDAPKTTILSIYGKRSENIGIGGSVYSDQAGALSRIGGNVSYAYHTKLSDQIKISLSLSAGFIQYKIIKGQTNVQDPNDPLFVGGDVIRSLPDATFGTVVYANKWYAGISVPQLLANNVNHQDRNAMNFQDDTDGDGKLDRHYYIVGAYKYEINPFWTVEPTFLFKSSSTTNQFDVGVRGIWDDKLWLGTSYRSNADISAIAGYTISDRYTIGYSVDMSNSELGMSHEFILGIKFLGLQQNQLSK
tara:strand:+ start:65740 stop:66657 length:918 start_codon:yes stop_codon:yes gene_type:complete